MIRDNTHLIAETLISQYDYYFSPEITSKIASHLTQTNFHSTSSALSNFRYVSPFFNEVASYVMKTWLKNQDEIVSLYSCKAKTATQAINFVKTHNLTKIDLSGINFTNKQIIELAKACPKLKQFCFNLDLISNEEYEQVEKDFPYLEICPD